MLQNDQTCVLRGTGGRIARFKERRERRCKVEAKVMAGGRLGGHSEGPTSKSAGPMEMWRWEEVKRGPEESSDELASY